jgi:hypothetical protein
LWPLLALALLAAGCAEQPARILTGQTVKTGTASYDDFFKAVVDLHAEAKHAKDDELATHAPLISALGLESKASAELTVSEAKQRSKKLRDGGLALHLELTPETKVYTKKETRDATLLPTTKDLIKAVEDSTRSAIAFAQKTGTIATRAAELEKTRTDLRAQAPATFRADVQSKRDEIIKELDAASKVIAETTDLGNLYAGLSSKFVVDLAHAIESGSQAEAAADAGKIAKDSAPPPTAKKPPAASPPSKPPPAAGAGRPSPPSKPAAPAGPKKPKGGDDFEP